MRKLNKDYLESVLRQRLSRQLDEFRVTAEHILVLQDGKEVCSICEGYENWEIKKPLQKMRFTDLLL